MKVLQQITVPQESVNDQYVTIVSIPFTTGDAVKKNDIVIEIETSKAVVTIEADIDGFIEYLCVLDDEVGINKLIAQVTDEPVKAGHSVPLEEEAIASSMKVEQVSAPTISYTGIYQTLFSRAAEQLIIQHKVDKTVFNYLDLVTADIVLNFVDPDRNKTEQQAQESTTVIKKEAEKTVNTPIVAENISLKKIKPAKKREIEYLSNVQGNNLVSTIYMDIDLGTFFDSVNPALRYFKDSVLPVFIYEASRLLLKYPAFNSYFSDGFIATYKEINIGIAMDMDDGLKVVKIPQTNSRSLAEIEETLLELSNKYLDKTLESADLTDVTFTMTDLASNGAYFFTPLVNKGNSAILGIAKVDQKLNRIIISLSFDHRVSEGKVATNFLYELKERIESYALANGSGADSKVFCYKCMKKLKDDLNNKGFIKVVNKNGEDRFICDSCLFNY